MYRWLMILGLVVLTAATVGLGTTNARNDGAISSGGGAAGVLDVNGYIVSGSVYRSTIQIVESNLDYMQGVAGTDSPFAEFDGAYAKLIRETGVDVVGLAGSISEAAIYQWGIDHGIEVSDDELNAAIDEQREIVATAEGPEIEEHRARIAEIGEERFWNEVLPRALRHGMVIDAVRQSQFSTDQDGKANRAAWRAFQHKIVLDASIESLDTELIDQEMIASAIHYFTEDLPTLYETYDMN